MISRMIASLIAPMASSLMQPVVALFINDISEKGIMGEGKEQKDGYLPLLALPLMIKPIPRKGVTIAARGYNNMDHMDERFYFYFIR